MSTEGGEDMSNAIGAGWTTETLYKHFSCMLTEMEKRLDTKLNDQHEATMGAFANAEKATGIAMNAAKEAVDKAERLATVRSEQQNEWRATVEDLTKTRISRVEYELSHKALEARLRNMETRADVNLGARSGSSVTIAWVIAGAGVFVAALSTIINLIIH